MFKYEMHCHTCESSRCGKIHGRDLADFYKKMGYDGIVVTDHFLNGNTTVDRNLSWEEKIDLYKKGYDEALKRGKEIGLKVFFGIEFSLLGTDFLVYGLNSDWYKEHTDCDKLPIRNFCDLVHESGGFIAQAHPYREASYIEVIRLLPSHVDAVEIYNSSMDDHTNKMASIYAKEYGLLTMCGSDNHVGLKEFLASLELDFEATGIHDIIKAVRENRKSIKAYELDKDTYHAREKNLSFLLD